MLCLKNGASLPSTDINPIYNQFYGLDIVYNGITEKSLQTRDYKNHFVGNNAGRSTLRKSIGSIFGYQKSQEILIIQITGKQSLTIKMK